MSSSIPESIISFYEPEATVRKKVMSGITGGRMTLEEQKRLGGEPEKCSLYLLNLFHMVTDDKELDEIKRKCTGRRGNLRAVQEGHCRKGCDILKDLPGEDGRMRRQDTGYKMAELTQNEKRLLATLAKEKTADAPHLAGLLETTPEAVVQWAHLAQDKGFAIVDRIVVKEFVYTDEGKTYAKNGLPETQLLRFVLPGTTLSDLQKHDGVQDWIWSAAEERACESGRNTGNKNSGSIYGCG